MIDTVHFNCAYAFKAPHGLWKITNTTELSDEKLIPDQSSSISRLHARHEGLGITMFGKGTQFDVTHVDSLPKILFGHNGRLISSNDEIYAALRMVDEAIHLIAVLGQRHSEFTRVDLVWQFPIPFSLLETTHKYRRQPHAKKDPVLHPGESIEIPLDGQRINLYDKVRHLRSKRQGEISDGQSVSRCEIQLRAKRLKKYFGSGDGLLRSLDIDTCYQIYRSILLEVFPDPVEVYSLECLADLSTSKRNILLLAMLAAENHEIYQPYLNAQSPSNKRLIRKKVAAVIPGIEKHPFRWSDHLPENCVPTQTEVDVRGVDAFDSIRLQRILDDERTGNSPYRRLRWA